MALELDLDPSQRVAGNGPNNDHPLEKNHGDGPDALTSTQRTTSRGPEGNRELEEADDDDDSIDGKYPEGGLRAWLVVLGAWCAMFAAMGILNTIGILHAWTAEHQLAKYSSSSIGWIYGAFAFFLYFGSAQVGMYSQSRYCVDCGLICIRAYFR